MKTYDLYGFTNDDLEAARAAVEQALGIRLQPHESLYIGEYYRLDTGEEENFELRKNVDPLDNEPAEQAFPEIGVLLYVNGSDRAKEIERALTEKGSRLVLLSRKQL